MPVPRWQFSGSLNNLTRFPLCEALLLTPISDQLFWYLLTTTLHLQRLPPPDLLLQSNAFHISVATLHSHHHWLLLTGAPSDAECELGFIPSDAECELLFIHFFHFLKVRTTIVGSQY